MIAISMIRREPHYRREAFDAGLQAAGYQIVEKGRPESKRDLLVIWNRYGCADGMADTWERAGGTVLVCENGYIGQDELGRQRYAIAVHGHNGSGWFPVGPEDRLAALKLDLKPWQEGDHILVCGQRGIGTRAMASPDGWHLRAEAAVKRVTGRPVKVRAHPGIHTPTTTIAQDLEGAHACVVWSSACGITALTMGVPVFYDAPHWVCEETARKGVDGIDQPLANNERRRAAFQKMAHGQWSVAEITSGEPFNRIAERIDEVPAW